MTPEVIVAPSPAALAEISASRFVAIANEAVRRNGQFAVALSGGSTPKATFNVLAEEYSDRVEWAKALFFFGDERMVPPESEESNFRMAREALLVPLRIDAENIFRWRTELKDPQKIAAEYERQLQALNGSVLPRFDLVMLGLGDDGHTASLFPGTDVLNEKSKLAAAAWVGKLDSWRLTLTLPVINNAANVMFIASGVEKAETVKRVLNAPPDSAELPASLIDPSDGSVVWFLDSEAARLLNAGGIPRYRLTIAS